MKAKRIKSPKYFSKTVFALFLAALFIPFLSWILPMTAYGDVKDDIESLKSQAEEHKQAAAGYLEDVKQAKTPEAAKAAAATAGGEARAARQAYDQIVELLGTNEGETESVSEEEINAVLNAIAQAYIDDPRSVMAYISKDFPNYSEVAKFLPEDGRLYSFRNLTINLNGSPRPKAPQGYDVPISWTLDLTTQTQNSTTFEVKGQVHLILGYEGGKLVVKNQLQGDPLLAARSPSVASAASVSAKTVQALSDAENASRATQALAFTLIGTVDPTVAAATALFNFELTSFGAYCFACLDVVYPLDSVPSSSSLQPQVTVRAVSAVDFTLTDVIMRVTTDTGYVLDSDPQELVANTETTFRTNDSNTTGYGSAGADVDRWVYTIMQSDGTRFTDRLTTRGSDRSDPQSITAV